MPENKNGVVIVTYNRRELLTECLGRVFAQTVPFAAVFVVDNGSTDGTREYLRGLSDPRLRLLFQEENLGGAGGFYEGVKAAREGGFDWVLLIDDDAMIAPDYMQRLLEAAEERERREGRTVYAAAGSVWTNGRIDLSHRRRISVPLERPVPEKEYKSGGAPVCDCATFCGLAVRGAAIREIGLPKKEYFLWYDDVEYCLRLRGRGGVTLAASAVLEHKTAASAEGMTISGLLDRIGWRQYYGYRNRYDTAKIHFGAASAFCVAAEYRMIAFCSRILMLKKENREKGRYDLAVIHDALRDGKRGALGKNAAYHP